MNKAILGKAPTGMDLAEFVGEIVDIVKDPADPKIADQVIIEIPGYTRGQVTLPKRFLTFEE